MKILALTHYYIEENKAGAELMLHGMLKALADAGHTVTAVITDTKRPDTIIDGVHVLYGIEHLHSQEYDVIISQLQNTLKAYEDARRRKKPMVLVVHNDRPRVMTQAAMLTAKDLVVFNTNWIKEKRPTRAKSMVLHPVIDREHFGKVKTSKKDRKYITLVNVVPAKGSDIFYYLAEQLPEQKFLGVKGGYWKDQQVIKDLPNVTIIEQTSNMRDDVYAKSRLVIMPSTYESYGMVAAEAMAAGVPVVVSNTQGLIENVDYGGLHVDGGRDTWLTAVKEMLYSLYAPGTEAALSRSKEQATQAKKELKQFVKAMEELV